MHYQSLFDSGTVEQGLISEQDASGKEGVIMEKFTGVKVFSATLARDREALGDQVTKWLKENQHIDVVDRVVMQSSDREFHCLSIILFYRENSDGNSSQ